MILNVSPLLDVFFFGAAFFDAPFFGFGVAFFGVALVGWDLFARATLLLQFSVVVAERK